MLKIKGRLFKDGDFWLIELPTIGAMTQAETRDAAFDMLKDYIETDLEQSVEMQFFDDGGKDFTVGFTDTNQILPWILRKLREIGGKSLEDAKNSLNSKSRNSYARYESGECDPSSSKLMELLSVTNHHLIID